MSSQSKSHALDSLSVSADPSVLPFGGGSGTIRVVAYDENLNPLANIPVIFTTDKGQLASGGTAKTTNAGGVVEDRLDTQESAVVTVSSGALTADITVSVPTNEAPDAQFVFSPGSPKVGEKVFFNASGSSDSDGTIVSYSWDFGDGSSGSGKT
ncbi:MAG: PKD domain-containing protein, partial [bacterium]|nr:PKD domain-containing protein [bacterium]